MPQIPSDFVQQIMPQGQIAPQRIEASPADFGAQVGQTLTQASDKMMQQAELGQQLNNETAVNDTINNKFFPAFQDMYQKYYGLQGKDAVDQLGTYQQSMRDMVQQYRADMQNPMQQRMFDQQTGRQLRYEFAGMGRHADQQNKIFQAQTFEGTINRQIDGAADKYNDPQALIDAAQGIGVAASKFYQLNGGSPEFANQQKERYWNQLFATVIQRRLQGGDVDGAQSLYQEGSAKNFITGNTLNQIGRVLKPYLEAQGASKAFSTITGGPVSSRVASGYGGVGLDPSLGLTTAYIESRLKPDATSQVEGSTSAGLFGMTDGTWAELGGKPEERGDVSMQIARSAQLDAQNAKGLQGFLQRSPENWEIYMAHQQGLTGAEKLLGNPNANAAGLVGEKAIVGNGGTPDMTARQFLDLWQGRFSRAATMYNTDGTPTALNLRMNYAHGLQAVSDLAEQEHPGDVGAAERYRSFFIQQAGQRIRAADIADKADRSVIQGAFTGANPPASWPDFMADPQRAEAFTRAERLDPGIRDRVDGAVRAVSLGTINPDPTAENMKLVYQLDGMRYADDPMTREKFKNMDLGQYLGKVPLGSWKQLMADQDAVRRGDGAAAAKNLSMTHALTLSRRFFVQAGFNPSSIFPADAAKYNAAVGRLSGALDAWRENNGNKVPSDSDILQIAQSTLLPQGGPQAGSAPGLTPVAAVTGNQKTGGQEKIEPQAPANMKRGDVLKAPNGMIYMKGEDGLWRQMPDM